ncbi:dihydroorotate dehydrogenase electron transfer subunit [Bacillaceae bacterium S4-13-58]
MNIHSSKILQNQPIAKDTYKLVLLAPNLEVNPGQFIHIKIGKGTQFPLRRPLSIADYVPFSGELTILYKIVGEGTKEISSLEEGVHIEFLGPLGNGYLLQDVPESALLIGGGIGIPPLYLLGKKLREMGTQVKSILGFQTEAGAFYLREFQELGETIVVTNDGSLGEKGRVTDYVEHFLPTIHGFYSCGPTPMLQAVTQSMGNVPGYISVEERMGCGIGACFACVCKVTDDKDKKGYRKICVDGPVFEKGVLQL